MSDLKTKLKPPRLEGEIKFQSYSKVRWGTNILEPEELPITYAIKQTAFDDWYDKHIEPLFANAVEVSGFYRLEKYGGDIQFYDLESDEGNREHRALLIGIEPIKEDTAEDILRDLITETGGREDVGMVSGELIQRAKKLVDKHKQTATIVGGGTMKEIAKWMADVAREQGAMTEKKFAEMMHDHVIDQNGIVPHPQVWKD